MIEHRPTSSSLFYGFCMLWPKNITHEQKTSRILIEATIANVTRISLKMSISHGDSEDASAIRSYHFCNSQAVSFAIILCQSERGDRKKSDRENGIVSAAEIL